MEAFLLSRGAGVAALLTLSACAVDLKPGTGGPQAPIDAGQALETRDADSTVPGVDDAAAAPSDAATSDGSVGRALPCNGDVGLCARRYDEVVFAATHNAHAAEEYGYGGLNANQLSGFDKQLTDGVRAFLMDVYEDGGEHVFCHGPCTLGKTSHRDGLTIFADFLAAHPREVLTFIYQDDLAADQIASDFAATGLDANVFTHAPGTAWPTLQTLIDQGTRLIVTAENGGAPPAWFHHVWDVAWDTPYDYERASEFSCELNRGSRDNDLFLINHWLGTGLGLPSKSGAMQVNTYDVLYERARGCWDETGDVPNFIAVDFYEYGELFQVVDALNSEGG